MMYIVTANRDITRDVYETNGVEVAGIFDDAEKAYEAKLKVEKWMEENECEDYEVYVTPIKVNQLAWYEIEEDI